ncbi:MAG: HEAT repeat domain-containing protein, partial [Gammaproteobacteria bacterium]
LTKEGLIGRLEVINITSHPEIAQEQGIRSVPWMRIGPFTLQGNHSPGELRRWAQRAASNQGIAEYLGELIESRRLDQALQEIRAHPEWNEVLLRMVSDLETPVGVRIGASAILEDLAEHDELGPLLPGLRELLRAAEAPVRADAAYYLGLSGDPRTREWLEPLLQDPAPEVREIAAEALEALPVSH